MKKVIRNLKRAMSIVLVVCVIFTSQAFITFAENVGNDDEARVEEINEIETTVEEIETIGDLAEESEDLVGGSDDLAGESEDLVGESEDLVGASTTSPEEKSDEGEIEEPEDDTDESLETDYPEEPEEDETDYIEEPEEDPTIAEITESTEDESTVEAFDEQETIENEQNSSGGSETEETNIEEESEEALTIEEIKDEKNDKLFGDSSNVAYIYYIQYNDSIKKWEKKYETITQEDDADEKVAALWNTPNTPFRNRFAIAYRLNPTDPSVPNLDLYNQFESTGSMYDQGSIIDEINNWKNAGPTASLHICVTFHKCKFYFFRLVPSESGAEKRYADCDEGKSDTEFNEYYEGKFNNIVSEGALGLYTFEAAEPMYPSDDDYNEYKTGDIEYECTLVGLKQAYDDWNDNPTKNICVGVMYTDPSASTTYTVTYNQNLPSGYSLSDGKTWYADATTDDLSGDPIELEGNADMTCEDASGNIRTLQGWNTYSSGAGSSYSFGDSINTDAGFAGDTLTLYAMWSDPVAPTTGFMYWKVDGDDNNKTIHYYASPGEGRAAVVIGTNGVEHTSLGSSDREKIKYAVFEDNIAATNLKCCFENFKGLESITNLGKLDTSNVTSMRQMFNFAGVKELDLTNFDTSNVTDMYGMFSSCENLETIRVSDKFVVDKVSTSNGKFVFANCDKLVGEKGTKISDLSSPFGVAYAHIDEGPTNPGLFSGASTPPTPPTPPTPAKTVESITVKSSNTTTIAISDDFSRFSVPFISNSESFDPNGMVITVTYDDGSTADVTYNNTTASQFTITYNAGSVDIEYGGKSVSYDFSVASEPNFYIYFNDNTNVKRAMGVYDSSYVSKIEDLYNYVSSGRELGFYVINATGLQDAYNKYNANATATMTLAEAMAEAQNITSVLPMTQYTFWGVTNRSKSQGGGTITPGGTNFSGGGDGGGSSSGASDPTKGPMGDLTKNLDAIRTWLNEQINTSNDIPQSSLLKDDSLASYLKSSSENINRPYTNAQDENGNRGYGQWLRVPNTTTWYFFSGDLSQINGQSSGFLANGWYNLGWDGQEKWYYFDANGVMKIGWHVIGGKMYYLDSNLSYNWYGSRVTGAKVIDGISYSFTDKGELNTTVGNNNIDTSQLYSQFVDNTANYNSAAGGLPPFNTPDTLPNQNEVHFYGGELSGPDMMAPVIAIY